MSLVRNALALTLPLTLAASIAAAAPITIYDSVASGAVYSAGSTTPYPYSNGDTFQGYQDTITSGPAWANGQTFYFGDIIGNPTIYDAYSLTIDRGPTSISFTLKTKYPGADNPDRSADFFISTVNPDRPDGFNYAIALGTSSIPGIGTGTSGTRGFLSAGLYQLTGGNLTTNASETSYRTSRQTWASDGGYGMGGLIQLCTDVPSDPGICDATNSAGWALEPAVLAYSGTQIGDVSVTRTTDGTWYYLQAVVTNADLSIFDHFDVLTASADCANDAIWGEVTTASAPAPGALFLLGFGLLGLGATRRRLK